MSGLLFSKHALFLYIFVTLPSYKLKYIKIRFIIYLLLDKILVDKKVTSFQTPVKGDVANVFDTCTLLM